MTSASIDPVIDIATMIAVHSKVQATVANIKRRGSLPSGMTPSRRDLNHNVRPAATMRIAMTAICLLSKRRVNHPVTKGTAIAPVMMAAMTMASWRELKFQKWTAWC